MTLPPPIFAGRMRQLLCQASGIAATEFGLIAPVFLLLSMAFFDLGHMAYARSVFEGAVEKAAREASLETGDEDDADAIVKNLVKPVLPNVILETERESYVGHEDIGRQEDFGDTNSNGFCDNGESYVDENLNGAWDQDIGVEGNGGANDVVIYRVTARYRPVFTLPFMPSAWQERELHATAIRKNQPFGNQQRYSTTAAGTCTDDD